MRPLRLFVTGTDTGVGKTEAGCALLSLLADAGEAPFAFKPFESGCARLDRPADALALRAAARMRGPLAWTSVYRFRAPLAPAVAATREGRRVSWRRVLDTFRRFEGRSGIVEGAGGLRVPLDGERDVIDLARALRMPVLLVARAGLGTLNHTALSLAALHEARLRVEAVLLVQSSSRADRSIADNPDWLRRRHGVRVLGPVPHARRESARRAAFREALAPLLSEWRRTS